MAGWTRLWKALKKACRYLRIRSAIVEMCYGGSMKRKKVRERCL